MQAPLRASLAPSKAEPRPPPLPPSPPPPSPLLSPPPRRDRAQSQRRAADRWRGAAARAQCPNGFYGAGGIGTEPPLGRERSLQRRQGTLRLPDPALVGLEAMPSSAYDYDARRSGRAVGRCQRSGSYSQATTPRTAGTDSSGRTLHCAQSCDNKGRLLSLSVEQCSCGRSWAAVQW